MSTQQSLTAFGAQPTSEFERRWGITRETLCKRAAAHHLTADGPRERFCEECGNRVTETNSMGEVGHEIGHGAANERCSHFGGGEQ
jgi:hypothetical protein